MTNSRAVVVSITISVITMLLIASCAQNTSLPTSTRVETVTNSPMTPANATNNRSCIDLSEHTVSFITVEPGVQPEVAEYDAAWLPLVKWQADAIQRFRKRIMNSKVVEQHDSNHYIFLNDEGAVARKMIDFLLDH